MHRRTLPILILVLGSASTYLFAAGAAELFSGSMFPFDPRTVAQPIESAHSTSTLLAPARDLRAATIIDSDPFDSTRKSPTPPPRDDSMLQSCTGAARLVIAAVDAEVPSRSLAVVDTGGVRPMVREGSMIGSRRVAVITRERVYLRDGRSYCFVSQNFPATQIDGPTSSSSVSSSTATVATPAWARGIRKLDDKTVEVDRLTRDAILDEQSELMKDIRVAPEKEGGRVVGLRLLTVRPDSLLGRLGLRSGDRLTSINGFEVTSPERMLEAYAKLRVAPTLSVAIVRGGSPMSIDVTIR